MYFSFGHLSGCLSYQVNTIESSGNVDGDALSTQEVKNRQFVFAEAQHPTTNRSEFQTQDEWAEQVTPLAMASMISVSERHR